MAKQDGQASVTTNNWGYNPTYNWGNPKGPFREIISRRCFEEGSGCRVYRVG